MTKEDVDNAFDYLSRIRVAKIRVRQLSNKLLTLDEEVDIVDDRLDEVPDLTLLFENKIL